MKIILSQLSLTTTPNKTESSSFKKKLKHYNIQEQLNNNNINKLIKLIDQECKIQTNKKPNYCIDVFIQLQEEYDTVRRLKNLKQKLHLKHDIHWDEEFN